MKLLLKYLRPLLPQITLGFFVKVIGTVMDLFLPWILSHIIDDIAPSRDITAVYIWGAVMLVSSVIAVVFSITANRMASRVAGCCTKQLRHDLYARITYLDACQTDAFTLSSLETRLTSDTYYVHQMVGMVQRLGVRAPILFFGGVIFTVILDPWLSLVMLCTIPFIGFSIYIFSVKSIPLYTKLQSTLDKLTAIVRENASGIRIIKALCKTDYEKSRFDKINKEAIRDEKKAGIAVAATNPLVTFFLNAGLTAVILTGAYLVRSGRSGTGKIIAFMSYFTIISSAMLNVSRMFVNISKGSAAMKRISEVLTTTPTLSEQTAYKNTNPEACKTATEPPHITFDGVCFSYGKTRVLDNISFDIYRGETLGIIGATGSGKSTVISLLLRTYDADSGCIKLNGTDIRALSAKELRSDFGTVFQNDFLFADTIRENVDFCRGLSDADIAQALSDAGALEFVNAYPEKDAHRLSIKGADLSGGQKQRLLIARALAGYPEVLILDDSSSALDYKTDSALRRVISEKYSSLTKIIIAQRVSSIMNADKIIMLDAGRIVAAGKHSELLICSPEYREIFTSQMGGAALE